MTRLEALGTTTAASGSKVVHFAPPVLLTNQRSPTSNCETKAKSEKLDYPVKIMGIESKQNKIGNKVYKYYQFDLKDYWTHPLNLGEIYFQNFENFNDPFECVFKFNKNGKFEEKKKQAREWSNSEEY